MSTSSDPEIIALMLGDPEPRLMLTDEAKAMYGRLETKRVSGVELDDDELRYHAALTLSLGTMFDLERVRRDWEATGTEWESGT